MKNYLKIGAILLIAITVIIVSCGSKKKVTTAVVENPKANLSEKLWYEWEEGLEKAIKEDKFILVDVYTDWCGWCKKMDRDTYANPDIKKLIAANAVAIKINPELVKTYELGGETYTGTQLIKFLANGKKDGGYPRTYFWLDPEGEEDGIRKYVQIGYQNPKQMTSIIHKMIQLKE